MTVDDVLKKFPKLSIPDESGRKKLQEALDYAEERNLIMNLMDKLEYLGTYADDRSKGCELYNDFAPYSLGFVMFYKDGKKWFNGGLIYYGEGDHGFGAPQFSVRLGDKSEGWSIHT